MSRVATLLANLVIALALTACVGAAAPPSSPPPAPSVSTTSMLQPVSRSNPSEDARAALTKCQIDPVSTPLSITGMGLLANPMDALHYVGLTGREPQLNDAGPVWVITTKGPLMQPSGDSWADPICMVSANDALWYATGPITQADGKVIAPLPGASPDLLLPPLAP